MEAASNGKELAVGCILYIKTTTGDEFEGQVITYDRPSNIVVIQEGTSKLGAHVNIRILKANYIKEFKLLDRAEDPLVPSKCYMDLAALQAREESAISSQVEFRQAEIEAERIGIGVTAEAQNIFDALSKTLPVRWDRTVIVVMNEVRVGTPYLAENVIGGTFAANDRVKKVLELERRRLQARSPATRDICS